MLESCFFYYLCTAKYDASLKNGFEGRLVIVENGEHKNR